MELAILLSDSRLYLQLESDYNPVYHLQMIRQVIGLLKFSSWGELEELPLLNTF